MPNSYTLLHRVSNTLGISATKSLGISASRADGIDVFFFMMYPVVNACACLFPLISTPMTALFKNVRF